MEKINVAVFFGGKTFEHDISILTGIEACQSLDIDKYNVIPVYLDLKNNFWTGEALLDRRIYPLRDWGKELVKEARLLVGEDKPTLQVKTKGMFLSKLEKIHFDVALLALHGDYGENGPMQGLCDIAGIPYTGCRTLSASVCMNKSITKLIAKSVGIPVLEEFIIRKPLNTEFYDIELLTKNMPFNYPVIVKPVSLGSSVGVSKANNIDELNASVLQVFALGTDTMVEPFVENLEDYNVSVTRAFDGTTIASALEHPFKKDADFLGFAEKYLSGNTGKCGCKKAGSKLESTSERAGFISMTREFNPKDLTKEQIEQVREWARKAFETLECNGVARIDFMCNSKTKEICFNEINLVPGSFAYYLWEGSEPSYTYTDLMDALVKEALELNKVKKGDVILSASKSVIFKDRQ